MWLKNDDAINFRVFLSTKCLILDSITFALFNFTATLSICFQVKFLSIRNPRYLTGSVPRCFLGGLDNTNSVLLILKATLTGFLDHDFVVLKKG